MADPVTLSLGGLALLGGLTQASGQISAANAKAQQIQGQQDIAEYNAKMLEQQAGVTRTETTASANLQSRKSQQYISEQRVRQAQSGYFGVSAEDILDQSAANAELDRQNILYQGESRARGLEQQAVGTRYGADILGTQKQPIINAGMMGAAGSIIGSVGQISYLNSQQPLDPFLNWGKM